MNIESLLKKWGVSSDSVIQHFIDQEVTPSSVVHLSPETIKSYIPKDGPRAVFEFHLSKYKESLDLNNNDNSGGSKDTGTLTDDEIDTVDDDDDVPLAKRSKLDPTLVDILLAVPNVNDIHRVLKINPPGLTVLAQDYTHGVLDDYTRDLLSQEAIYEEIRNNYSASIDRDRFDHISDQIVELFKTEAKVTWYDPGTKNGQLVVRGRLRNKFYSVRKGLISSGLVRKKTRRTTVVHQQEAKLDASAFLSSVDDPDFQWLMDNKEPWATVRQKWDLTRDLRLKFRTNCPQNTDYLDIFPSLKEPLGWELVASDGIHQYPVLESCVNLWKDYSKVLLDLIKLDQPKFRLKADASDDENFVSLIREVPKLFKVKTISKSSEAAKRSTCMRPSQQEINRGFCLHVNTIPEVDEALNERKKLLEKYKFPNQPVPIFLGPIQTLDQYFIAFEDYRWEVDGPMQAFFGTFSVYFGLDSSYPAEAKHVWLFLQHTLLKIEASEEFKKDRSLKSCLAARLKHFEFVSSR